jgi:hypothetical protein
MYLKTTMVFLKLHMSGRLNRMPEYLNNAEFYALLKEYHKTQSKQSYEKLGKCFLLIAENLLHRLNFIKYTPDRKDEMISDAVFYMCKYMKKFKMEKDNPFSYFTAIAKNAFLQRLNHYKKMEKFFTSIEYIDNCDNIDNVL